MTREHLHREAGAVLLALTVAGACVSNLAVRSASPTPSSCRDRAVFGLPGQSAYVLPYPVGAGYPLLQSYCTKVGSHGDQLAYDLLIPEGSPITASRAGAVFEIVDRWDDSDRDVAHFNYVLIRHDDDSVAFYAHLQAGSLVVQVGDRVAAGQLIGNSGHSGTSVANLHFGVYRTWPLRDGDDLPINFRNAEGSLDARGGLQAGVFYTATDPHSH